MTAYRWYPVQDGNTETLTFELDNYRFTYLTADTVRFTNVRYGSKLLYEGRIPRRWTRVIRPGLAPAVNRLLAQWPLDNAALWWHSVARSQHHALCPTDCALYLIP